MPINNPVPLPASVGVIRFSTIDSDDAATAGKAGYWDFHDGKWIILSSDAYRSIGNAQSGANIAQSWLFKLFENVYGAFNLPIYTSTGQASSKSNVISDWNAEKRLALPDFRGRAIIGDGTGQAGINRSRGTALGSETHTLSIAEIPSHAHATPAIGRTSAANGNNTAGFEYGDPSQGFGSGIVSTSAGNGQSHNNMQPSIVIPIWISAGTF